ncbi:unnamed protein product [Caretta caretta]
MRTSLRRMKTEITSTVIKYGDMSSSTPQRSSSSATLVSKARMQSEGQQLLAMNAHTCHPPIRFSQNESERR